MWFFTFQNIDGYDVVTGKGRKVIDPEATQRQARTMILRSLGHPDEIKSLLNSPGARVAFAAKFLKRVNHFAKAHPVWCDLPNQIRVIDESLAVKLSAQPPPYHARLTDGSLIADYRGKAYWLYNERHTITELGVTPDPDARLEDDLSDVQIDELWRWGRIHLPDFRKRREIGYLLLWAQEEALDLRRRIEITAGPQEAITQARALYKFREWEANEAFYD